MADDIRTELKLSQALVMTPQLQLAIKLLAMPSTELQQVIDNFLVEHPGKLAPLADGAVDPAFVEAAEMVDEMELVWEPLESGPFLPIAIADVWVFGNPPQARANGRAYPRYVAVDNDRDAKWIVRSFHQRARTYEKIVAAAVALRPELAVTLEPAKLAPVDIRAIADSVGLHESTVTRVATGCRFQNLHGMLAFAATKRKLGFANV